MARAKQPAKKYTPEERNADIWNQHVFLIKKKFPQAEKKIVTIMKTHHKSKKDAFLPSEEATEDLRKLYLDLNRPNSPTC